MTQHDQGRNKSPSRKWLRLGVVGLVASIIPGCATFDQTGQPLVPSRNVTKTGVFAVYTGRSIAPDSPAIQSLASLEEEVGKQLGVHGTSKEPAVEVYVLKDREAFSHFLTFYYPELPTRRAFFLAQGSKRVIYTFENDRLQEDLRHEGTHALLHETVGDLPLWLDEGLAEYFEGPSARQGVNPEHLARLPADLEKGWKPNLKRLEQLKSVKDMTPRDYRESWAWIHYLLDPANESGRATLTAFLADIQSEKSDAEPLSDRLVKKDAAEDQQMLSHLEQVRKTKSDIATERVSTNSKILFQSPTLDPKTVVEDKRGVFSRFLGFFGIKSR